MNIFGVQSHLYKKIGDNSSALFFRVPSQAGNRYDSLATPLGTLESQAC